MKPFGPSRTPPKITQYTSTLKAIHQVLGHPYQIKCSITDYHSHPKILPLKKPSSADFLDLRAYLGPTLFKIVQNI